MSLSNIIDGWKNYIFPDEETEALAYNRAKICATCPHNKQGDVLVYLNDKLQEVQGSYCDLCGCPLSAKLRSPNETCDEAKW
jgi:ribosomal protein L37E